VFDCNSAYIRDPIQHNRDGTPESYQSMLRNISEEHSLIYTAAEAWNHAKGKSMRDLFSVMSGFNFQHLAF
jgi:hypothetical protein